MSFDLQELETQVLRHGDVARVVIASVSGSTPREVGAAMLVWQDGQTGTIGGGALELEVTRRARAALGGKDWIDCFTLGPALGQCCGGALTILSEIFDENRLRTVVPAIYLRRVTGDAEKPLDIKKQLYEFRNSGKSIKPMLSSGWFIEQVDAPKRPLWIYGAGHVGRAVVALLSPLPQLDITWIDSSKARFPNDIPSNVTQLIADNPADVVQYAPTDAEHLVFTYSHALDLEICHRLLLHGFSRAGLIGSKTKWARFRARLAQLNHAPALVDRITCPIGAPELGKHPQAIAIGIASEILSASGIAQISQKRTG